MQSDLDVQLMLQTKYNYVHKLREAQADMEVGGIIIIDQLTVARNHILVNAELFGGAQEKYVPPWTLNENDPKLISSIPLFAGSMPLPDIYTVKVTYGGQMSTRTGEDQQEFPKCASNEFDCRCRRKRIAPFGSQFSTGSTRWSLVEQMSTLLHEHSPTGDARLRTVFT